MKRIISILVMCFLCISIYTETAYCSSIYYPKNILVLGDSISTGYGLEGYNEKDDSKNYATKSYANQLRDKYNLLEGYKNFAVDGYTSSDLLSTLKSNEYDNYIQKSEYVIISIGGNDIIEYIYKCIGEAVGLEDGYTISDVFKIDLSKPDIYKNVLSFITTKEEKEIEYYIINRFRDNLFSIEEYIHSVSKDTRIIFQTVFNPVGNIKQIKLFNSLVEDVIIQLNNTIKDNSSVSDKNDVTATRYYYVDIYDSFSYDTKKYTNITKNDIHPNQEGHKIIFQKIDTLISNIYTVEISPTLNPSEKLSDTKKSENNTLLTKLILYFITFGIITLGGVIIFRFTCKK